MKNKFIYLMCCLFLGLTLHDTLATPPDTAVTHYLTRVYPLLPKNAATISFAHSLDFYYAPFVPALHITPHSKQFYCLAWMYACGNVPDGSIFRNHYSQPPFIYRHGYPPYHYVEVMHYKWYEEPALYFYAAKGSGIFLNTGNTLIAKNKIEALRRLGFSDEKIASYAPPSIHQQIQIMISQNHLSYQDAVHKVIQSAIDNTDYKLNRLAGGESYDTVLADQCRQQHYATFQFTIQPNDNGSFGYEVMDCRTPKTMALKQRWLIEQRYLSQRNPLNLQQSRDCHYTVPFSKWLTCTG